MKAFTVQKMNSHWLAVICLVICCAGVNTAVCGSASAVLMFSAYKAQQHRLLYRAVNTCYDLLEHKIFSERLK